MNACQKVGNTPLKLNLQFCFLRLIFNETSRPLSKIIVKVLTLNQLFSNIRYNIMNYNKYLTMKVDF